MATLIKAALLLFSLQETTAFVTPSNHRRIPAFPGSAAGAAGSTRLNMEVVEVDVAIVGGGPAGKSFNCVYLYLADVWV